MSDTQDTITPKDLKQLLDSETSIQLIDNRAIYDYEDGHIPGAQHYPFQMLDELNTSGWDTSKLYVCYTVDDESQTALKASEKLKNLGFEVTILHGGIEAWKTNSYPIALIDKKEFCCGRGCGC